MAFQKKDPDTGGSEAFHKRWDRLPISKPAVKTSYSTTALRQATCRLEETYVERARPEGPGGAYHYHIHPGVFEPSKTKTDKDQIDKVRTDEAQTGGEEPSWREPDGKESDQRKTSSSKTSASGEEATSEKEASTRRRDQTAGKASLGSRFPEKDSPEKDFSETGFSETESGLLRKLTNAEVWPREAGKLVQRYSAGRVEANFQLWRRRKNDPEAPSVGSDGAFLRAAIAEGYAAFTEDTPSAEETICAENNAFAKDDGSDRETTSTRKAAPAKKAALAKKVAPAQKVSHKQKVSPREKRRLTREEGMDPAHFHRYRRAQSQEDQSPEEKQFLYLDPAAGGPQPREGVPAT